MLSVALACVQTPGCALAPTHGLALAPGQLHLYQLLCVDSPLQLHVVSLHVHKSKILPSSARGQASSACACGPPALGLVHVDSHSQTYSCLLIGGLPS